jgi:hypothetical protein
VRVLERGAAACLLRLVHYSSPLISNFLSVVPVSLRVLPFRLTDVLSGDEQKVVNRPRTGLSV